MWSALLDHLKARKLPNGFALLRFCSMELITTIRPFVNIMNTSDNFITSFVSSVQETEREDLLGLRTFLFENLNGKLYLKEI